MKVCEIVEKVKSDSSTSPRGAFTLFVKLNDKWGIKLFWCEEDRDLAYENQKLFASYGVGPEVGGKIDLPEGEQPYGYITEVVELLYIPYNSSMTYKEMEQRVGLKKELLDQYGTWDDYQDRDMPIQTRMRELEEITGVEMYDMHLANWGIKNGELIPIDFGFNT